jgi:hypothetical protein
MTTLLKSLLMACILIVPHTAQAKQVSFDNGQIIFDVPDEFTQLAPEVIAAKYASKHAPEFAVGNKAGSTTIAYDIKPHNISSVPLSALKDNLVQNLTRIIPGVEWVHSAVIQMGGREWIYFEMTSNAIDTNIYNMMLVTAYNNEMLLFNFNSTIEEIETYRKSFHSSIESISIK